MKGCFWSHAWTKWEDKEHLRAKPIWAKESDDGILVIIQERRCTRCNAVALRQVRPSL